MLVGSNDIYDAVFITVIYFLSFRTIIMEFFNLTKWQLVFVVGIYMLSAIYVLTRAFRFEQTAAKPLDTTSKVLSIVLFTLATLPVANTLMTVIIFLIWLFNRLGE